MDRKTIKKVLFVTIILMILVLYGCSSIDQKSAENIAAQFVKKNVKVFSKGDESNIDYPSYQITSLNSYKEGKLWIVNMHIEGSFGNETKKNDIVVKVSNKGEVLDLKAGKI